jgi:uncharacterized membrane protein YfcA
MDLSPLWIAAIFLPAGLAKGVIGLGLPTIGMGLLALLMSPVEAAAVLALPSLVTNIWQMLAGARLLAIVRRLWPMMLGVCLGTWAGAGLITCLSAGYATIALGGALILYAISGLTSFRITVRAALEPMLSPIIGAVTGVITAATGVFVVPAVPYLQGIGMEKDELVQALGLSFTVSTLALAVSLAAGGAFVPTMIVPTIVALCVSLLGMWLGQLVRERLSATTFRRCFFIGLLLLGLWLVIRSLSS